MRKILKSIDIKNVKIGSSLIGERINTVIEKTIPYQWLAINDKVKGKKYNNTIKNFKIAAGDEKGEYEGLVFQDSDVAKWIEGAAYSLVIKHDDKLEKDIDEVIDIIVRAQHRDGYLNTYYTLKEPGKRLTDLGNNHELYCAGHMIEAAVAYYQITGKRKLLDAMCRYSDFIDNAFGTEEGKQRGYDGHEEVELALVKLYHVTGNEKYLNLAKYFIKERGKKPYYFNLEELQRGAGNIEKLTKDDELIYSQSHLPVIEQTEAVGHAVRAMYFYCGLTDVAYETEDEELKEVCRQLWEDVTLRKMYITGSIGSSVSDGEAFTFAYDLPNDTTYSETCAAIGLVFWAQRMMEADPDSRYTDVIEKALYNGILSGISMDGQHYFYVNPLEVWPEACEKRRDKRHVKPIRQEWYTCSCCPPNIVRLLTSMGQYLYSHNSSEIYVNQYIESISDITLGDNNINVEQKTMYPWDGRVDIKVTPEREDLFTLAVRVPGWCRSHKINVNGKEAEVEFVKGYAKIKRLWKAGDVISLDFAMDVIRMQANPNVRMDAGKVSVQRGPVVYCIEEIDNGEILSDIYIPKEPIFETCFDKEFLGGAVTITCNGFRSSMEDWKGKLYREYFCNKVPCTIKLVPYYLWNNRGKGEMTVWMNQYC